MKKLLFLLFISTVLFGYINAKSITIQIPDGSPWEIGKQYQVKWTIDGDMHESVKLRLFDNTGNIKKHIITESTPNSGSYFWTVPESVPAGQYFLRVKTVDNDVYGDSAVFSIKEGSLEPSSTSVQKSDGDKIGKILEEIKIVSPVRSSKWEEGGSYNIQWKNEFVKNRSVKIILYDGEGEKYLKNIATILGSNVNSVNKNKDKSSGISSFSWYITRGDLKFPGNFRIKVRRTDGKASGMSEMFRIEIVPVITKYKIYGVVNNQCKRKLWVRSGSTDHLKSQSDKVPCKINNSKEAWVGYSYRLMHQSKSEYVGDVFRSFVYFEFSEFKKKGVVLSAKLKYSKSDVSSGGNCKISIYKVNSHWSDPFKVDSEFISSNPKNVDLKNYTWSWIGYDKDNYGLMFVGGDESFVHTSKECRSILRDIYIEIEFLESK